MGRAKDFFIEIRLEKLVWLKTVSIYFKKTLLPCQKVQRIIFIIEWYLIAGRNEAGISDWFKILISHDNLGSNQNS